jgi:hypothetical protein
MCSRRAGLTALLLLAWTTSACMHWKVQDALPEQVATRRPYEVRVTRDDGSRVVLRRPEIVGDTLYGAARGRTAAPRPGVALADVSEVALRRFNVLGSMALGLGTAALAGVVVLGLVWSSRAD